MNHSIDTVVNFAAESHVDRSIEDPGIFLKTNILGTQILMDVAKSHWSKGKDENGYPKNILEGKKLPVYGDGKQVRDWLYVEDHCKGIDLVINKGRLREAYNIRSG